MSRFAWDLFGGTVELDPLPLWTWTTYAPAPRPVRRKRSPARAWRQAACAPKVAPPAPLPDPRPWLAGPVVCAICGRRWVAVRSVWGSALECPTCGLLAGHAEEQAPDAS